MTIFEKLIAVLISIAAFNAVTFSNLYFNKSKIPQNNHTNNYLADVKSNENKLFGHLFATGKVDVTFTPPLNLSYTAAEFQKYKGTYLVKTEPVGMDYFNDTIFLGDSLTYGLQGAHIPSDKVLAIIGRGVYDLLDIETTLTAGSSKQKIIDWLVQVKPKKIYINLGTNGIDFLSNEIHMQYYIKMLDRVKTACPTAKVILVGISPWGEKIGGTANDNGINKKINHFNTLLLDLAKTRGLLYVNACEALINGRGALAENFNAGDGVHWTNAAGKAYMDYLKSHKLN